MPKPFYITTPIYYVNDKPHIGHAYTTIAADLMTRFHRMNNREAFFLTGTDEHGSKIAEAAEKAGLEPQKFCDEVVKHFKTAWKNLSIENDDFIRTTEDRHLEAFRKLVSVLKEARTEDGEDVVYSDVYEGMYCTGCEKFLTDKELVEGLCPDHRRPPIALKENNYFFRLSGFKDKLRHLIETDELIIRPEERRREVLGLFDQELPDFSISRERVKWGVRLPFDEKQVAYVWIDALSNYITAIGYGADEQHFKKWWYDSDSVHLVGKDILKFHCIFWPAILMAAGLPLPRQVFVHGYFTIDGEKMSKSLGNMIDPNELVDEFGPDAVRYLLLTQYPFGGDGDVKRSKFINKYNSDLANDLGNLISRVAKMIATNYDGILPEPSDNIDGLDDLTKTAENLSEKFVAHLDHLAIGAAIDEALSLVRLGNRFFDSHAPWQLLKKGDKARAGGVLYTAAEIIRIAATLLYPVMPGKMLEALAVFGLGREDLNIDQVRTFFYLKPGSRVKIEQSVFPRLTKEKKDPKPVTREDDETGLIDISEFSKAQLVVAEILNAEKVAGADKLLKMQIDIGGEKRQIVAGIAQYYQPDNLVGKKIVVVKNLKPARIRGVESNGMLLAATKGKKLVLVVPDNDIPSGATIS